LGVYAIKETNASRVVMAMMIVLLINLIALKKQASAKNAGVLYTVLTVTRAKTIFAFGRVVLKMILDALLVSTVLMTNVLKVAVILEIVLMASLIAARKRETVRNA